MLFYANAVFNLIWDLKVVLPLSVCSELYARLPAGQLFFYSQISEKLCIDVVAAVTCNLFSLARLPKTQFV